MTILARVRLLDALDSIILRARRGPLEHELLFGELVRWERHGRAEGLILPPHIVDLRVEATPVKVLDGLVRLRELVAGPGAAGEIH
jgi:hypothetical protein